MSLKYKILLPTVALIALTMTVVTLTSYIKTSASLEKAITDKIELLTEEVKTSVNVWIQDRRADVLAWSQQESFVNALTTKDDKILEQASRNLASLKRHYPMYENLLLVDDQGLCRAASDSSLVSKLQLDGRAYFKQAMQGEMAVSDVLKSKATDNAIVVFAAPVKSDHQVKGVVLGTVNVAYLAGKFVDHVKPGGAGYLYAIDRRGLLVAYPKKQEILKLNLSEYGFGRAMMDQKSGLISYEFCGVDKIVAFAHIPALDWIVASTANTEELFAPARELGQFNTIIAIISVLVAGLLAWLVSVSVVRSINRVMDTLNDGANQVAAASDQVSASSQSLAEGASEQAASLEESSTSLEEISAMVESNAENALQADELMHGNQTQVTQANSSMKKLKQAMKTISRSSDETAKVIKTIDEIAFQTNLLALNAAVEAARAGEAGAGFAVVADEVRNLSMRAAEAAKSTSNMIAENIEQIKTGAELVNQTDTAFDEVAKSSSEIDRLIKDIAEASKEQADGIKQLNHAVRKMDQVVQHNASDAEESAAAAEELSSQAQSVNRMVELLSRIVGGAGVHRTQEPELINNAKKMYLLPWRRV